jgi:hypothetical protein
MDISRNIDIRHEVRNIFRQISNSNPIYDLDLKEQLEKRFTTNNEIKQILIVCSTTKYNELFSHFLQLYAGSHDVLFKEILSENWPSYIEDWFYFRNMDMILRNIQPDNKYHYLRLLYLHMGLPSETFAKSRILWQRLRRGILPYNMSNRMLSPLIPSLEQQYKTTEQVFYERGILTQKECVVFRGLRLDHVSDLQSKVRNLIYASPDYRVALRYAESPAESHHGERVEGKLRILLIIKLNIGTVIVSPDSSTAEEEIILPYGSSLVHWQGPDDYPSSSQIHGNILFVYLECILDHGQLFDNDYIIRKQELRRSKRISRKSRENQ